VENPGKTFPAALSFAMALTLMIDVMSMVTGMSVVTDYENWHDGTFMDVAEILGGAYTSMPLNTLGFCQLFTGTSCSHPGCGVP
jgi:hypothetical protein